MKFKYIYKNNLKRRKINYIWGVVIDWGSLKKKYYFQKTIHIVVSQGNKKLKNNVIHNNNKKKTQIHNYKRKTLEKQAITAQPYNWNSILSLS